MYNTTPTTTAQMVFANSTSEALATNLISGKIPFPLSGKSAVLLYGAVGTGKSTYARIFCNDFETARGGVVEDTMIEYVSCDSTENITQMLTRCNKQRELVSFNRSGYHYFVFDEVDNLTDEAQRKLKAFLNYTNIVCVLTTNYVDKVDVGVRSRCFNINFNASDTPNYLHRLKTIIRENNLPMPTDAVLTQQIALAEGDWRDLVPFVLHMCTQLQTTPPNGANKRGLKVVHSV
ncbi:AAA family ATPase [Yoonia sp.]|uniref:AAA family ATPase n=1 Tax=Yoonia sp. TaxID=2212373 RepID=UPI0040474887